MLGENYKETFETDMRYDIDDSTMKLWWDNNGWEGKDK